MTASSTEAKYVVMGGSVKEAVVIQQVSTFPLHEMRGGSIRLLEDKVRAANPANNHLKPARSGHIDVRHHLLGEMAADVRIEVNYVETQNYRKNCVGEAACDSDVWNVRDLSVQSWLGFDDGDLEVLALGTPCMDSEEDVLIVYSST